MTITLDDDTLDIDTLVITLMITLDDEYPR
jgi:hypothetical protein